MIRKILIVLILVTLGAVAVRYYKSDLVSNQVPQTTTSVKSEEPVAQKNVQKDEEPVGRPIFYEELAKKGQPVSPEQLYLLSPVNVYVNLVNNVPTLSNTASNNTIVTLPIYNKKVYTNINKYAISPSGKTIYFALHVDGFGGPIYVYIYSYSIGTNQAQLIERRQEKNSLNVKSVLGEDFIVLERPNCFGCEGWITENLVLNTKTLKEVTIPAGDKHKIVDSKYLTYYPYTPTKIACTKEYLTSEVGGCDSAGMRTDYYFPSSTTTKVLLP